MGIALKNIEAYKHKIAGESFKRTKLMQKSCMSPEGSVVTIKHSEVKKFLKIRHA